VAIRLHPYATALTLGILQRFHLVQLPVGAVLAASAFASFDPAVRIIALLAGGTLAPGLAWRQSRLRLTANASPETFSNFVLSTLEDLRTIGLAALAAFHPVVMLAYLPSRSVDDLARPQFRSRDSRDVHATGGLYEPVRLAVAAFAKAEVSDAPKLRESMRRSSKASFMP
jgi:uncharacterized protein DUF4126